MTELQKATLVKLTAGDNPTEDGTPVEVQFNPASMRLALTNETEGGRSRGRQERQFTGLSSTDLTFDLVFDTADEDNGGQPRSVREKTAIVEQFVLASASSGDRNRRLVPPRVRFRWGDSFHIDGVIKTLSIDFDFFAANGTPLRAKMSVSIKEQNPRYELQQRDQGANGSDPAPGEDSGGAPGSTGGGPTDRTATALAGESAADFAARVGLDPGAWRAVAGALDGTLSLQAGLEIDFSAGVSLGAGISAGFGAGISAGVGVSLEASFGLDVSTGGAFGGGSFSGGVAGSTGSGFALSAAGGVSAAVETVAAARSDAAATAARNAFVAPPAPARTSAPIARPSMPEQPRAPLRTADAASPVSAARESGGSSSAPPPPLADARATSYGFGVPLRPRIAPAADQRSGGRVPLRPYARLNEAQVSNDPGAAPWISLPAAGTSQPAARALARAPSRGQPSSAHIGPAATARGGTGCGCGGGCKCGCGGR